MKMLKKCLLVSSETPHPSGSIPPINLAQLMLAAQRKAGPGCDSWKRITGIRSDTSTGLLLSYQASVFLANVKSSSSSKMQIN